MDSWLCGSLGCRGVYCVGKRNESYGIVLQLRLHDEVETIDGEIEVGGDRLVEFAAESVEVVLHLQVAHALTSQLLRGTRLAGCGNRFRLFIVGGLLAVSHRLDIVICGRLVIFLLIIIILLLFITLLLLLLINLHLCIILPNCSHIVVTLLLNITLLAIH